MSEKFVINIWRQFGSGGREIGEKLAQLLKISFYDKELINISSKESGLEKEFFEKADEKTKHSFFAGLFGIQGTMDEMNPGNYLSNETLFQIQSNVIRKLAEEHSCIFVGRCADYVLKDHPRSLNIFICAEMEDRVKRIMMKQQLPEKKAIELIEKTDKKRAGYYNYYSNKTWGVANSYHLCINSSALGVEGSVDFLKDFACKKFGL